MELVVSDTTVYVMRWINMLLAMICVIWLIYKANHNWSHYSEEAKAYVISLGTFSLTVLYLTAQVLVENLEGGSSVFLSTIALGCVIYALWHTQGMAVGWRKKR